MNNTSMEKNFCDLTKFAKSYEDIHGILSFLVCVFGSVANVLNICVLTTKEMRWPTNLILTGLAVADLLVMLEYIPFTFHRYIYNEKRKYISHYSYNWAVFMFFHALFSQTFHFISCCLTVILAIWRYITITNSASSPVWCGIRRTIYVILTAYIICPIICVPLFVSLQIVQHNQTCDENGRIIDKNELVNYTGTVQKDVIYYTTFIDNENYKYISLWVYGVVIKLVPCVLLTHLSWRLISVLLETKRRRNLLLNSSLSPKHVNPHNIIRTDANKKIDKNKQADRTSSMLLAVLLLFLITEFPQAILGLLSAIIGEQFQTQCYIPLGDLMDFLALTNSAINFILYCTMSRQFRSTFREFFRPKIFHEWIPLVQPSHTEKNNGEKTQLTQV